MKIKSGDLEVLESGVVFTNESSSLNFDLDPQLSLKFNFLNDFKDSAPQIQYKQIDANSGEITLINYNHFNGRGVLNPTLIGTINNRQIYLAYWVTQLNPAVEGKKFEYTFYVK
jgi:hypothetical protein